MYAHGDTHGCYNYLPILPIEGCSTGDSTVVWVSTEDSTVVVWVSNGTEVAAIIPYVFSQL